MKAHKFVTEHGLKIEIRSESEFNEIMTIAELMGYHNGLEFKFIPDVKCLFLKSDSKHIRWSHRSDDDCFGCKEISVRELKEIAAGYCFKSSNGQAISKIENHDKHIDLNENFSTKQDLESVKQSGLTESHINESYKLNRLG